MSAALKIDYSNPDEQYKHIFELRSRRIIALSRDPEALEVCKVHYANNPWDFINDWGMTFDPRKVPMGQLASMPFILWPKQVEYLKWLTQQYYAGERGLTEKSRDCGVTWLSVGWSISMFLFNPGFTAGFGSQKKQKVDKKGDPSCIFEKIRFFYLTIPKIFRPKHFDNRLHMTEMKLVNPDNGATITGEVGDDIGRGGRTSIFFVDEAAHIEHQFMVDAALSQNTDCQIDISTPNGTGNEFYKKAQKFEGTTRKFVFDYKDDPRKDDAWLAKQIEETDEAILGQEVYRDYEASSEDIFIPAKWVRACIDAHITLGFRPEGIRVTSFDPADVGDAKAGINRHGVVITEADQLKSGDITQAIPWVFDMADKFRTDVFIFDGDGMGAPSMKLAIQNLSVKRFKIVAFHGSAGVINPNDIPGQERFLKLQKLKKKQERDRDMLEGKLKTNADTYGNYRAQAWSWFRERCELTYIAVERAKTGQVVNADPADLVSISSNCNYLNQLVSEISRPKRIYKGDGKILVESKEAMRKRGVVSPNLADSAVMAFSVNKIPEEVKKPYRQVRHHYVADTTVGF